MESAIPRRRARAAPPQRGFCKTVECRHPCRCGRTAVVIGEVLEPLAGRTPGLHLLWCEPVSPVSPESNGLISQVVFSACFPRFSAGILHKSWCQRVGVYDTPLSNTHLRGDLLSGSTRSHDSVTAVLLTVQRVGAGSFLFFLSWFLSRNARRQCSEPQSGERSDADPRRCSLLVSYNVSSQF